MKAGDKKGGRERKEKKTGFGGVQGSDGVTDTETYRGWRRQEEKRKQGVGVEVYGCLVCQACDVAHFFFFFRSPEYSEDDVCLCDGATPLSEGSSVGFKANQVSSAPHMR